MRGEKKLLYSSHVGVHPHQHVEKGDFIFDA